MDRPTVVGRACGSCMMCCKLPKIVPLSKDAGVWCKFAKAGKGCTNYEERPDECRTFYCDWMLDANLSAEWKPTVAKFLTYTNTISGNFTILPDIGYPNSWKSPIYYSTLKTHACKLLDLGTITLVSHGKNVTVLLPDRDETVTISPNDQIILKKIKIGNDFRYEISIS